MMNDEWWVCHCWSIFDVKNLAKWVRKICSGARKFFPKRVTSHKKRKMLFKILRCSQRSILAKRLRARKKRKKGKIFCLTGSTLTCFRANLTYPFCQIFSVENRSAMTNSSFIIHHCSWYKPTTACLAKPIPLYKTTASEPILHLPIASHQAATAIQMFAKTKSLYEWRMLF